MKDYFYEEVELIADRAGTTLWFQFRYILRLCGKGAVNTNCKRILASDSLEVLFMCCDHIYRQLAHRLSVPVRMLSMESPKSQRLTICFFSLVLFSSPSFPAVVFLTHACRLHFKAKSQEMQLLSLGQSVFCLEKKIVFLIIYSNFINLIYFQMLLPVFAKFCTSICDIKNKQHTTIRITTFYEK